MTEFPVIKGNSISFERRMERKGRVILRVNVTSVHEISAAKDLCVEDRGRVKVRDSKEDFNLLLGKPDLLIYTVTLPTATC